MPLRSKAIMAVSALMPGTANSVVLGSRGALCAENHRLRRCRLDAGFEAVAQAPPCGQRPPALCGRSGSGAKAGNGGDILGSRAQAALLAAALDQRLGDMDIAAADQRAGALRAAELVRGKAHQIGAQLADIAIDPARRPAPRRHAARRWRHARSSAISRDRLDHAGLVVGEHHRDQRTLGPSNGASKSMKIDHAVAGHRQFLDRIGGKPPAAAHRRMLDRRDKQPVAQRLAPADLDRRASAPACWLRWRRGEGDVLGLGADQRRDLLARLLDQTAGGAALGMHRRGIAGQRQRGDAWRRAPPAAAARSHSSRNRPAQLMDSCQYPDYRQRLQTLLQKACFLPWGSC